MRVDSRTVWRWMLYTNSLVALIWIPIVIFGNVPPWQALGMAAAQFVFLLTFLVSERSRVRR